MYEDQNYYTNRHSCFWLRYHLILMTKYRHPVIDGEIKNCLNAKIKELFDKRKLTILKFDEEKDHIHILFEADPFTSPGEFVNVLKTQTSKIIRKTYSEILKQWYESPSFWAENYLIITDREDADKRIKQYITGQKN